MASNSENNSGKTEPIISTGPVGKGAYEVQQGDCIESIAFRNGHFWEYLWDHIDNKELKDTRKNPNTLLPNDKVTIPPLRRRDEKAATDRIHKFKRKGVPSRIHITVKFEGELRANEPYVLRIDDKEFSSTTSASGEIIHPIPPDAVSGELWVGKGGDMQQFSLKLGWIDPITELSGVQARLANLGFFGGEPDGEWTDETAVAIGEFQESQKLKVTSELDEATKKALEDCYKN
jgi:N-acetylmuramoyl-L-alanine amidase